MTIIEKALTRLETIEKQEKNKKPPVEEVPESALEPLPTFGHPPGVDFIVSRVKRRRNRQKWIYPVTTMMIVVVAVIFAWRTNLFNVKQLVENSEMYRFVVMMTETPTPLPLSKIPGLKAENMPIGIPESSVSPTIPLENPEIITNKPEIAREEVKSVPKLREYSWIRKGWTALDGKRGKAALKSWEAGLRSLPRKHMVLVAGVHKNQGDAWRNLRRIGKGNSAFVARGKDSGKNVYFLLAAPYYNDLQNVRRRIAANLNRSSIKGNYANKILARMRGGAKIAKTSTGKKKQTIVAKTAGGKSRRSKQAAKVKNVKQTKKKRRQKFALSYGERLNFVKDLLNDSLYSDAVDNLQPLFDTPPIVWEPYLLMGTAYLGLGDLEVADSYFKRGLAIDAKRPRLWLQRAVVAQQRDDHGTALEILHKVETLAPRMPEIKLNIGYSNDVLGKKDDAAKAYQSFLALTESRRDYFTLRRQVFQRLLKLGYKPVE